MSSIYRIADGFWALIVFVLLILLAVFDTLFLGKSEQDQIDD